MKEQLNILEEKIARLESSQIQQNRNIVSIIRNIVEHGFGDSDGEKRKAAWISLGGYFFRQRLVIIVTSLLTCLLSFSSIFIAYNANELIGEQNSLIKEEFKLIEAERRSSLIFLMSNVMDKLYEEIEEQRKLFIEDGIDEYNMKFNVSPALRGRIIGLSRALRPYHILEKGAPSKRKISPERGQILITLLSSQLNNESLSIMFSRGDFSYADLNFENANNTMGIEFASLNLAMLQNAELRNVRVFNTDCHEIQLDSAILQNINFEYCDVSRSNFSNTSPVIEFNNCNLEEANFTNSDLRNVKFGNSSLCQADFKNVKNLKFEHFKEVKSLYGVKNLPREIEIKLDKRLFEKKKCKNAHNGF